MIRYNTCSSVAMDIVSPDDFNKNAAKLLCIVDRELTSYETIDGHIML